MFSRAPKKLVKTLEILFLADEESKLFDVLRFSIDIDECSIDGERGFKKVRLSLSLVRNTIELERCKLRAIDFE